MSAISYFQGNRRKRARLRAGRPPRAHKATPAAAPAPAPAAPAPAPVADDSGADDLTAVKWISARTQETLNNAGVTTYAQLVDMDYAAVKALVPLLSLDKHAEMIESTRALMAE